MYNVIFDMDGLMFDTESVFVKAWDYAGEKMGIGKAGYMVLKTLGMSIVMSRDIWYEEFGEKYDEDELRMLTKEFLIRYYEDNIVPVKDGLFDLLDFLKEKEVKIAVASSSPEWEVRKHLKNTGIIDKFEAIVCGDMVENSKPEPDIYSEVCKRLGVKPSDCIALEDSKNGLLAAYKAGRKPIMVPDLWQPDDSTKEVLFAQYANLIEVKGYLEKNM